MLTYLSDDKLHERTLGLAKTEQETTIQLLHHMHEVERRTLFAKLGFSSLWDYTVKALGYSEVHASERISAMRLIYRVSEAKEALQEGKLNLTQAVMTERYLRAQAKEQKAPVPIAQVKELISVVSGKTKRETEKILLSFQASDEPKVVEKLRQISEEMSEARFSMNEETRRALERFFDLKGRCSLSEVFSICLNDYLERKDPSRKPTPRTWPASSNASPLRPVEVEKPSRYIPASIKREVRKRSGERCEYINLKTQRRCDSTYLLQYDHIHEFALGGDSTASNLRMLCANHNGYLAEKMYAMEATSAYG